MASNELLGKFRELMEKKKDEQFKKGNSANSKLINEIIIDEKTKNISDKMNVPNNYLSTNSNTKTGSDNSSKEIIIQKSRPSVFNFAKRFELRDSNEVEPINKLSNKSLETSNSKEEEKKLGENNVTNITNEIIIESDNNYFSNDYRSYSAESEKRKSTNKDMIKNSIKSLLSEESEQENQEESNKQSFNRSNSNPIEITVGAPSDISSNIITALPRRSVLQIVKMNEKRINTIEKRKSQRKSVNEKFKNNMDDIARYLQSLKKNEEERIDSKEFLERNSEKLKECGINEKDLTLVQELIKFYEKNSKINEDVPHPLLKKRNTINNTSSFKRFNLSVQTIKEENDEDLSIQESFRLSNNRKNSASINESNKERNSVARLMKEQHDKNIYKDINSSINYTKIEETQTDGSVISNNSFDRKNLKANFASDNEDNKDNNEQLSKSNRFDTERCETFNTLTEENANTEVEVENNLRFKNEGLKSAANEISITYRSDKINKIYYVGKSDYFTLKDSNKEVMNNKIKNSLIKKDNGFIIEREYKNKNFKILKMIKVSQIRLKPKEKEEYFISNKEDFNYIKRKKKRILVIQNVNNFELKKMNLCLEEGRENLELINNIKKDIRASVNEFKSKSFLEDQFKSNEEEKIVKSRATNNMANNVNINKLIDDDMKSKEIKLMKNISDLDKDKNKSNLEEPIKNRHSEVNRLTIENFLSNENSKSKYQKNIIHALDSISISQYNINSNIPLDPMFFDVLCINCYECVKYNEIDEHSEICIIHSDDHYQELLNGEYGEEDYNSRIYKLHESLKKKQIEIYKTKDESLITIYEEFSNLIYEILINNNSIENLDKSITALNEIMNNKLNKIKLNYKFTISVFGQRISQLVYSKLNDMEKILMCVKPLDEDSMSDEKYLEDSADYDDPENEKQIQYLKMELANLERQTLTAKVEIEQWKKESKKLENMLRKPNANTEMLSDINSEVVSRRDESFDVMSNATGQTSEYDNSDIANMKDVNEILELNSEEEFKKYFLSIGLSLKFKYADRITKNSSIADLYEKARDNDIPISEWYTFICQELKIH